AAVRNAMAATGIADTTEGFRKARDDAEHAIALDPMLASGYLALATTQMYYDWDWDSAQSSIAKASDLEPGSADVLRIHSYLSRFQGRLDEAISFYEKSVALDPLRTNSYISLANLQYNAGCYPEAYKDLQRALDLNAQAPYIHQMRSKVLLGEGKPQQALDEIAQEPIEWARLSGQAIAYHALGRANESNAALAGLIARHTDDASYQIAEVYAYRGQVDKSFEWLDRAYEQRDPGLPEIKTDPLLPNLRRDQRYADLLKKMRLGDYTSM